MKTQKENLEKLIQASLCEVEEFAKSSGNAEDIEILEYKFREIKKSRIDFKNPNFEKKDLIIKVKEMYLDGFMTANEIADLKIFELEMICENSTLDCLI